MNSKFYWQMRKLVLSIFFFLKKMKYRYIETKENLTFKKSLNLIIIKTVFNQLFLSSLLVTFIVGFDHFIIVKTKIPLVDVDLYKELLLGGMGIAGVILGLYCANIASVFSAKYSNVPKQIAHDFQNDIVTKSAIKEIVGYIVICTLMLILCIAKISLTLVSVSVIAFITIRMVIVFSISGTRTYILSDTFRIADIHINNIHNAIKKISKKNAITSDISFQRHIQKMCEKDIAVLSEIAKYNLDIPATQNLSMCEFMDQNLVLIGQYWRIKNAIPHNSKWFADKTIYPQWHTVSNAEVELATCCGTSIDCREGKNSWWFEEEILSTNEICLDKLIQDSDVPAIIKYLNKIAFLSSEVIDAESNAHWIKYLNKIGSKMLSFVVSSENVDVNKEDEWASIFDILASTFVAVLKSENRMIKSLNVDNIFNHACKLNNNYDTNVSFFRFINNETCDSLYRQINTEKDIEKKKITPDWFIKQTVAKQIYIYLGILSKNVEKIMNIYVELGKELNEKKLNYCAAVFLAHCFEIMNNCEEIIESIDVKLPIMEKMHFEESEIWEKVSLQNTIETFNSFENSVPSLLIRNCGSFAVHNWNDRGEKPDFLGLCYNHICENLINAIETNDYTKFEAFYSDFFTLTLLYQEYVRTDVIKTKEKHLQSAVLMIATDPYVEFGIISGLATLWGEFISDKRWGELVQNALRLFIQTDEENHKNALTKITQIVMERRNILLGITNRSVTQTSWEMRVARAINSNKLFEIEYSEFGQKSLKTKSKLLYTFVGNLLGDNINLKNTEDVFFVVFANYYLDGNNKYKSRFGWEKNYENEHF